MTGSTALAKALATDYRNADLAEADRAMLDYAVTLTRTPTAIGARDVERLRERGFGETAILDVCQVVSYYNYVNRLADGLGVELEPFWRDRELTIDRETFERRREASSA